MKIDQDYLKGLLEAFQAAKEPYTDIEELKSRGFDYEENCFLFHLQILDDKDLIESRRHDLGIMMNGDGSVDWAVIPLRLTADGHEFIEALQNKDVWTSIQSGFKEASIDTLMSVSKDLLQGFAKKKIKELTGLE